MTVLPAIGVQLVALVVPIGSAVIGIRARTTDQGHLPAGSASEGGVEVGYAHTKLFDAIRIAPADLECSHGNPIRLQSQTEDDAEEYSRPSNERYILTPGALVKLSLLGLLGSSPPDSGMDEIA